MSSYIERKIQEFEGEGLPHSAMCREKPFSDCDKDCPNKVAKAFLRTSLSGLLQEIESAIPEEDTKGGAYDEYRVGYNACRAEIINKLREL